MQNRIIAIRHGETFSNRNDRVSGGNDNPPLTTKGVTQAFATRKQLKGQVGTLFSSPKERCLATGLIAFGLEIPLEQRLDDLNERYYGAFDGGPNADWKAFMSGLQPKLDALSTEERRDFPFGLGIENERQLIERALGAVAAVADQAKGQEAGISTSGGILRGVLLGCGYALPTGAVDNLATLTMDHDGESLRVISMSGIHLEK